MTSTPLALREPAESSAEPPRLTPLRSIAELAQAYILDGPQSVSWVDQYIASWALQSQIAVAAEHGLKPRDVVLSLLRPTLDTNGHCRCASCQNRCLICHRAAARSS